MITDAQILVLREIFAHTVEKGWHICSWAALRTSVFSGTLGWKRLKSWCAANELECSLCPSQASKAAEVQFRNLRRSGARAMIAPA